MIVTGVIIIFSNFFGNFLKAKMYAENMLGIL